jgi:hypothetical protein
MIPSPFARTAAAKRHNSAPPPPRRSGQTAHSPLWPDTQPLTADDELAFDTGGFRETLEGLQVRELHSPDLFQVLFGSRR